MFAGASQASHFSSTPQYITMPKRATEIIASADKIRHTWIAHPTFRLGGLTLDDFITAYNAAVELETAVQSKRHELQGLIAKRSNQARALKLLSSRALSGFRAVYGPDSPQYTQAGGTRTSQRAARTVTRKAVWTSRSK
jgi:hypothetical protein